MSQVEINELTKVYAVGGEQIMAVDHVSLKIRKGEFISIVGHSGSGKTTLISIIGGILRPSSGQVRFDGSDICSLDDDRISEYRNQKISFMFQFASLLPALTVRENILLPCVFSTDALSKGAEKADEYLELLGIPDKVNAYPSQLSGGQQRRVAIARALINQPELILADEPTGDLDEETESEIVGLFHRINHEQGITFVVVTHNREITKACDQQYRMDRGVLRKENPDGSEAP